MTRTPHIAITTANWQKITQHTQHCIVHKAQASAKQCVVISILNELNIIYEYRYHKMCLVHTGETGHFGPTKVIPQTLYNLSYDRNFAVMGWSVPMIGVLRHSGTGSKVSRAYLFWERTSELSWVWSDQLYVSVEYSSSWHFIDANYQQYKILRLILSVFLYPVSFSRVNAARLGGSPSENF